MTGHQHVTYLRKRYDTWHNRSPVRAEQSGANVPAKQQSLAYCEGCRWLGLLTGVATTISGLVFKVEAWTCMERPPTTSAVLMSVDCANFSIMLCT